MFVPVVIPISFIASWLVNNVVTVEQESKADRSFINSGYLESNWHTAAKQLADASPAKINQRLQRYKEKYPFASVFWVDHSGTTRLQLPVSKSRPAKWSVEDTVQFMKKSAVNRELFTVVAFLGDSPNKQQGFMVIEAPRTYFQRSENHSSFSVFGITLLLLFAFFAGISYLFFRDIRKRLLTLESAMHFPGEDGLPRKIHTGRADEIGMLEQSFNYMVDQLRDSRQREQEEERLRKRLISNLSHDLRTPLTVVGSHLYSLKREELSEQGRQSLALMQDKISDLDHLIDHLLSYNLLASGKYAIHLKPQDVLRIVRESAAAWYPLWEREGLVPDINLDREPLQWSVDEQAFRRVLDNLFQNAVRHAKSGHYIGIETDIQHGIPSLTIIDHGPGIQAESSTKGAGLGLAIVHLLLKEMSLQLDVESSGQGTRMRIQPRIK